VLGLQVYAWACGRSAGPGLGMPCTLYGSCNCEGVDMSTSITLLDVQMMIGSTHCLASTRPIFGMGGWAVPHSLA
jgi:hypothetical protein